MLVVKLSKITAWIGRAREEMRMAASDHDLVVRIGGDSAAGGIVTTGEVFARIASFVGLEIYTTRTIPAEIKGGHVMFQVRVADRPVHSQGDELDLLVAYDQESFDRYYKLLKPDGIFVYNSNDLTPPQRSGVQVYGLPLNDLARKIDFVRGRNILLIGALVKLFDLPYDRAVQVVRKQLGRKKEMLDQNLTALQTGYRWVEENIARESPFHLRGSLGDTAQDERLVISGNQALSIGAIAAGCRFYAGYPITPASDIMEFLAAEFPKIGGTMIQAEDEIAAIGMAVGAAYTGLRAMTATSGPGLALMIEMLGHASMTETPVVIVDVQRAGPSTGMPTKVSQGDLRLAVFGGNDDAPRFVVAPVSVEDCFYQIIHAFNLAEKYQTPVLFLSDQDMSVRVQTIPPFDLSKVKQEPRLVWDGSGKYERYADTPSGVSPMSLPGMRGGQYTAEGLEHYVSGAPGYAPELHRKNMEKRYRKLDSALCDIEAWGMYEQFGDDGAALGIIGWGSTIGPVREAVARAKEAGIPVAVFYPKALFPLPDAKLHAFLEKRQAVIVPEMNYTGQFAGMLRARAQSYGIERPIVKLNQYGGVPLSTQQVYEQIVAVREKLRE
jgi:2-oxoglutarate ferredoxin oxidoreductase subunit alpha